ncbi:N-methyl-L-tryptophan oxidase [Maritalea sp.]|uniref:N-methyl-L-tryptophan oxidase n=1 Tax=Maritalea sp. TaxID=2003361 RepID=UPI003EF32C8C
MPNRKIHDVAVIGLGAMGSATLYQLAKQNTNVIGIDQFTPPHTHGSTHGETRVTRCAIGEGIQYTPLALRSHEIWKELASETGEQLLFEVGGLMISTGNSHGSVHGSANFLDTTIAAAKKFNIEHELLTGQQIRTRFPGFDAGADDQAYFEPGAGYLKVEECVQAQLDRAIELGAKTVFDTKVLNINSDGDQFEIETDGETISAKKLVVSAGPWVNKLLGAPYSDILTPSRQVLHWYPIGNSAKEAWTDHPVFIWLHGEGDGYYGLPSLADPNLIKVAAASYGDAADPDAIDRNVTREEQDEMFETHVKGRLAGIEAKAEKSVTCIYTVTPDSVFVIDTHPDHDNMMIISACSGHGFKHSAAIGEAVAQQMLNNHSDLDLSAFKLSRFTAR